MKEIECPNCGAMFSAGEPECPYCGHINPMGAEAKFLRDLEKTRKELDDVDDEARAAYGGEIKKGAKSTLKTVMIVAVIIAILVGGFFILEKTVFNYDYKGNYADELAWEHEAFAEYDELFEAEKYEDLMERIATDGEKHDVWNWENYDEFMEIADELWGDPEDGAGESSEEIQD